MNYKICLQGEELHALLRYTTTGIHSVRLIKHAMILLKSNEHYTYSQIESALNCGYHEIWVVRKRYCEEGLEACLHEKARSGAQRKISTAIENHIIALACEMPPKGRKHWSFAQLHDSLANRFQEYASTSTIGRILKKNRLRPWKKSSGSSRN
jgi:hypothetical protein